MATVERILEEIVEGLEARAESCMKLSTLDDLDKSMIRASVLSDVAGVIRSSLLRVEDDGEG